MNRALTRSVIILAWLIAMAWLVRYEAFPQFFTHTIDGYKGFVPQDTLLSDSWMKIVYKGETVGYSHSMMDIVESDPARHYVITHSAYLTPVLAGKPQRIDVDMTLYLDELYDLAEFSFDASIKGFNIRVTGERVSGRTYRAVVDVAGLTSERVFDIPKGVVLYSPMTALAIRKLKPGRYVTVRTMDPISMSLVNMVIRARRNETITIDGVPYESTVLTTDYRGSTMTSWVDQDGILLRQETPFGWTLVRCAPEEAVMVFPSRAQTVPDETLPTSVGSNRLVRTPMAIVGKLMEELAQSGNASKGDTVQATTSSDR